MAYYVVYWGSGSTERFQADSLAEAFVYYYKDNAKGLAQAVSFYDEGQYSYPDITHVYKNGEWVEKEDKDDLSIAPIYSSSTNTVKTKEQVCKDIGESLNSLFYVLF